MTGFAAGSPPYGAVRFDKLQVMFRPKVLTARPRILRSSNDGVSAGTSATSAFVILIPGFGAARCLGAIEDCLQTNPAYASHLRAALSGSKNQRFRNILS